ncbi:MAG: hypothetical protein V7752_15430 [Halopseudomonas sp.]
MKTINRLLTLLALSFVLTACGGGGETAAVAPATSGVAMPATVGVVK